ncbi:MAG: sugar phosphate isomerase/epimerase [Verrucomicrobia bacterium]|nr:sugar phosphate isomerase/epimerase [Verrucomicrobiota bacterium]
MKLTASILTSLLCTATLHLATFNTAAAESKPAGLGPSFKGPLGLQLYSLRAAFSKDVPSTLAKVAGFGFKNVETAGTYGMTPQQFKELLDANKLTAVAGHFSFDAYRTNLEAVVRDAKTLGLQYAGCAWIPHEGEFGEADCRKAIAVFSKAGEELAKAGIKFFYHCHGYEFKPHGDATFMDALIKGTKPEHVRFEMDVFWVVHPGHDPVKWLAKYPGRWELMHVKDMKKGTPCGLFTGKSDVNNDVVLGTGVIDWPALLREAARSGVKWYFIEDESDAVAQQIPQSLRFLEQVRW